MGTSSRTTSVLAALVLVLCAVVAATTELPAWPGLDAPGSQARSTTGSDDGRAGVDGEEQPAEERAAPEDDAPVNGGAGALGGLLFLTLVVLASALVVVAVLRLRVVRRRGRLSRRAGPRAGALPSPGEAPADEGDALTTALDEGARTVGEGAPRNAIVRAWLRLEEGIVSERFARRASDTPTELVTRALSAYRLDEEAIHRLAELYEEARFSAHPVTEAHRREAGRCLHRLLASVGDGAVR